MKIEEAVKKAIEGGWTTINLHEGEKLARWSVVNDKHHQHVYVSFVYEQSKSWGSEIELKRAHEYHDLNRIFLDPSFWQSLGKALGWSEYGYCCTTCGAESAPYIPEWNQKWLEFTQTLADGKTAEEFFAGLAS